MAREYTEYEREAYGIPDTIEEEAPETAAVAEEVVTTIEEAPAESVAEEKPEIVAEEKPIVEETPAPYKSKKFIEVDDEKALYEKLNAKYRHENMKPEEKALAFIKQQHPELDDDDILFMAASEYGIGVEKPSEAELTDDQMLAIRKQDIARKKLTKQAQDYFADEAGKVALPDYDPLDLDPDYKEYRTNSQKAQAEAKDRNEKAAHINQQLETNAKTISEITESVEIELDKGKFVVPINFKLNEEKQKQLADFAKRYTPTTAEYDSFNDPETGKFDYKGYVASLAPIAFAKDIARAGMSQALAKDREQFIEKELKNSTLRNNDVSAVAEKPYDFVDDYWSRFAGK